MLQSLIPPIIFRTILKAQYNVNNDEIYKNLVIKFKEIKYLKI